MNKMNFIKKNAPKLEKTFHGRLREIASLSEKLNSKENRPVVLYGLSGIGKTQLVLFYLEELGSCYQKTLWNVAGSQNEIQNTFNSLSSEKNIVIFDHVNSRNEVAKYLPKVIPANITVIITTHVNRRDEWKNMETMKLNGFSQEDAESFIAKDHRKAGRDKIRLLIDKIGTHPLVLKQVLQYMSEEKVTVEKCMEILDDDPLALLDFNPEENCYGKTAFETVIGVTKELGDESKTKNAICLLSHLAAGKISVNLFPSDVLDVVEKMNEFSLLHLDLDNGFVYNDQTLAMINKTNFDNTINSGDYVKIIDQFSDCVFKKIDVSEAGIKTCQEMLKHFEEFLRYLEKKYEASVEEGVKLNLNNYLIKHCNRLSYCYDYLNKYSERKIILEKLLSITKNAITDHDSQSIKIGHIYRDLAWCEYQLQNYEKADKLYNQAHLKFEKNLNPASIEMYEFLKLWTLNKSARGNYQEADKLFKKGKSILDNLKKTDGLEMAELLYSMAMNKRQQSNFELAHRYFVKSIETFKQTPCPDMDVATVYVLYDWAWNEKMRKNYREALDKFIRCHSVFKRVYGDDYELTVDTNNQIEELNTILESKEIAQSPDNESSTDKESEDKCSNLTKKVSENEMDKESFLKNESNIGNINYNNLSVTLQPPSTISCILM